MKTHLVAVYGTLLEGEHNANLASDALSRRPCALTGTLYDTGYGFPSFVPDGDTHVFGELLEVTPTTFARLDRLEGYPHLYTRRKLPVSLPDGTSATAWVYIMNRLPEQASIIASGAWRRRRKSAL